MSTVGPEGRSYIRIDREDLVTLSAIAANDRAEFFDLHPDWAKVYRDRFVGAALCQGAALHFTSGQVGIQDFDVYSFYAEHPARRWYAKRSKHVDFGNSKFGKSLDRPEFIGRRVDLLGRALPCEPTEDFASVVREWLRTGRTTTSRMLAQKAVVLLTPDSRVGEVVWPTPAERSGTSERLMRTV